MQRTHSLVGLVILCSLPLSPAFAQMTFEGKQVITAHFVSGAAPVIEGQINPDEWSAAVPVPVTFEDVFNEPGVVQLDANGALFPHSPPPENEADLSYTVRALYDGTNLYLSVDVNDDIVIKDSDSSTPWQDDDVELYFDGDRMNETRFTNTPSKEGFQLITNVEGDQQSTNEAVEWEVAVNTEKPQGYQVEFRIALSSIDVIHGQDATQAPQPGDYIGFNIVVGDDDNGGSPFNNVLEGQIDDPVVDGFMKWTGTGRTFDESDWGLLFFKPAETAVEASTWGQIKSAVPSEPTEP